MLLVENGHVLAALDILSKELVHAGRRYSAGGLSTVVTRQQARAGAMSAFFSTEAQRYRPSFEHTRIELYPGDIDKLW